jgi:hypothetical protein
VRGTWRAEKALRDARRRAGRIEEEEDDMRVR